MKNIIIAILVLVLFGIGVYFLTQKSPDNNLLDNNITTNPDGTLKTDPNNPNGDQVPATPEIKTETVLGKSVNGTEIKAYHYGVGDTELLFVGGIHGGYSWNTTLLAYEMMDYLKDNPQIIPSNIKVTVVPVMNPDGLAKVTGSIGIFEIADVNKSTSVQVAGRFNANNVDLSRNFDCEWQTQGVWQNKTVSGGPAVFSEPESVAMKNYIENNNPNAVVVWYSAAGGVYASSCNNGASIETLALTDTYAKASGYPAYKKFDSYKTNGDFVRWMAKINIPAISVLLTNHQDVEWDKNKLALEAMLTYYAK